MSSSLWNVFEEPEAVIREGGWLKLISGMQAVPDDYGVAFLLPNKDAAVCAPMPWHTVYGLAYRLYWWWRIGWTVNGGDAMFARAFAFGVEAERALNDKRRAECEQQHAEALTDAVMRGRKEAFDFIEDTFNLERRGRTDQSN